MNLKKVFGVALNAFKAQYIPTKDSNLRMTWGGAIAVEDKKNPGMYIAFDGNGQAFRYPEAMTMKLPVFFINRPIDQIKTGDVIKQGTSYFSVIGIKDGNVKTRSFTGFAHTIIPITDVLIGGATIPVAINLLGAFGNGQTNPLAAASTSAQNNGLFGGMFGGNLFGGQNSMMQMMLMSQMMGGGSLFGDDDASDEEFEDDEYSSMDRRALKLYQQHNRNLGVKVYPSMSDEDIRNAIRKAEGKPTSDSCECGGTMEMLMMSQILGGGQMNGMNPLAFMMLGGLGKKGGDSDNLMMLLMMSQMGNLQAMNTPVAPAAAPAAPAAGPTPVDFAAEAPETAGE